VPPSAQSEGHDAPKLIDCTIAAAASWSAHPGEDCDQGCHRREETHQPLACRGNGRGLDRSYRPERNRGHIGAEARRDDPDPGRSRRTVCRCTGYQNIVKAVRRAAAENRAAARW